jgi:hypothetical protein
MNRNQQELNQLRFRQVIKPLIFALIACGIAYYLFSSFGPITTNFGIDVSFLILPFIGYYLLRFSSKLCRVFISTLSGTVYATILNGLAFSWFCYFLFSQAPLLSDIPALARLDVFCSELQQLSGFALLFIIGCTIVSISEPLKETVTGSQVYIPDVALGQIIIGFSLWQSISVFSQSWAPFREIGLMIFIGMLAVAVSNIGDYGKRSQYPVLADASKWLKEGPAGKFFLAVLISSYFIFIRPAIMANTPWAHIIEWLIFCIVSWIIFAGVKRSLENEYCLSVRETAWKKHGQKIDELVGDDFNNLVLLQQSFVDLSAKDSLMAKLKQILTNNKFEEKEISQMLVPIKEYGDRKVPWYIFGHWKQRILKQNRKNRQQVLEITIENVRTLVFPSRQ